MKKLTIKNKKKSSDIEDYNLYRYPEDTIDGFKIEEEYAKKRKNINEAEYKKRLLIVEKRCNDEKEDYIKNIHLTVAKWGIDNKIYIKDLLKEITKIK